MALNAEQRATVARHLESVANGACPMCRASAWQADDRVLYLSDSPTEMGLYSLRALPVECTECGHVVLFSGSAIGI